MAKFCVNCGNELKEDQDFCTKCGKKISSNVQTNGNINEQTSPKNNSYALTGFILGLISMFCINLFGIVGLLAIIFSSVGLSQINKTHEDGKGMAIVGLVLGIIGLIVGIILTLFQ